MERRRLVGVRRTPGCDQLFALIVSVILVTQIYVICLAFSSSSVHREGGCIIAWSFLFVVGKELDHCSWAIHQSAFLTAHNRIVLR